MTDHEQPLDASDEGVAVWFVPAPFDFEEDNWRAMRIVFARDASAANAASALHDLAREFDHLQWTEYAEGPYPEREFDGFSVHFETDLVAETAALLLYRAAFLVEGNGIPTEWDYIALTDPDGVWSRRHEEEVEPPLESPEAYPDPSLPGAWICETQRSLIDSLTIEEPE
jgi:hypothetical protein